MPGQMMWGTTSANWAPPPRAALQTEQLPYGAQHGFPALQAPFGVPASRAPAPGQPGATFGEVWQAQQNSRKRLALDPAPRAKRRQISVQEAANDLAVCSLGKRHRDDINMLDMEYPHKAPRTIEETAQDEQYALVPFKPAIEYLHPKRQIDTTSIPDVIDVARFASKPAPTAIVLWKPRPQHHERVYEYDV